MKSTPVDQLVKASKLWSQYASAADRMELQARRNPAQGAEALRKAMVFRQNANQLYAWMHERDLVKGYPIPKKFKWQGLGISIESPAGSARQWYDPHEKRHGITMMLYDYGYIRGTDGVDGDKIDAYLGPHLDTASSVYVVRQLKGPDFRYYDEDKCMIGFECMEDARIAYLAHYDNPRFIGAIDEFPVGPFVVAVRQTRKAPAPVGGWWGLTVQQRISDLEALPAALKMDDLDLGLPEPAIRSPFQPPLPPVLSEDVTPWKEMAVLE